MGSLEVTFSSGRCRTVEKRDGKGARTLGYATKTAVQFVGMNNTAVHRTLLPLPASGRIKKSPLVFDMLDDSALRAKQTLRYEGEIEVPIKRGTANLDSYVQTGQGIVPTHYLVDGQGQVQLITMATVNWALIGR